MASIFIYTHAIVMMDQNILYCLCFRRLGFKKIDDAGLKQEK